MQKIFNNWLGGQFARVEILDTRKREFTNVEGKKYVCNESLVRFPASKDAAAIETNGTHTDIWIETEQLDDDPEPGFREWTGYGVFAV